MIEPNLLAEEINEMISIKLCYTQRFVPCPAIIRNAISSRRWEQRQKPIARQYVDRRLYQSLSLENWNPKEEGQKILGVSRNRGHQESRTHMVSQETEVASTGSTWVCTGSSACMLWLLFL